MIVKCNTLRARVVGVRRRPYENDEAVRAPMSWVIEDAGSGEEIAAGAWGDDVGAVIYSVNDRGGIAPMSVVQLILREWEHVGRPEVILHAGYKLVADCMCSRCRHE